MADDPTATDPQPGAVADLAPVVDPTPEPVAPPPDPVAELRERNARLEGEMVALRAQVNAAAAAPRVDPAAQWTPASIRAAYDAGQITDDQRVALLAQLQTRAEIRDYDAERRVRDTESRAGADLQTYLRTYPALNDPQSPLMREVVAELRAMQTDEGANPQSLVSQLRAVKSIVGTLRTADAGGAARRSIPVGGVGTATGGAPARDGGKPNPLKGIPPDIIADWKRLGANLDDPVEAGRYAERFQGMLARRQRRTSGVA